MAAICKVSNSSFPILALREVIPDQTAPEQWKELNLNTGGTHSTLQDIKLPEGSTAGGYCYKTFSTVPTRNRFIYWQTFNDVLELVEHSLDLTLHGNFLRLRFQGLPILEGTSVHETANNVVILVTTISSVHRLIFPHPLQREDFMLYKMGMISVPSIFTEASLPWLRESANYHVISNTATNAPLPYTASSCLVGNGNEALFALASSSSILLIKMGTSSGAIATWTLQPASFALRLLSGFIPQVLKSSVTQDHGDATASVTLQTGENDTYILALSKSAKLRIWSATTQECRLVCDLLEFVGDKTAKQFGSQRHSIRCTGRIGKDFKIAVFLSFSKLRSFLILKLKCVPAMQISCLVAVTTPENHLIDFSLTSSHLYAFWSTIQGESLLQFMALPQEGIQYIQEWQTVTLEPGVDAEIEYDENVIDPKQVYLGAMFTPGKFSVSTLNKALQAFQRSVGGARVATASQINILKEEIITVVENEISNQAAEMEITDEDYVALSQKCWAQFYTCVVQYHLKRPVPVGLLIDENTGFHCLLKKGMFSFLRPLDLVENLVLQPEQKWQNFPYSEISPLFQQQPIFTSLLGLLKALSAVNDNLSAEQVERFNSLMFQLQSADQIAKTIADELLQNRVLDLLDSLVVALSSVDICLAFTALLQLLSVDISNNQSESNSLSDVIEDDNYKLLFSGPLGISSIASSARQMADLRLGLCRDVLITQQLLILANKKLQLSSDDAETIRSEFLPRTVPLTHAYYALAWICQCSTQYMSNTLIEKNIRQMAVLGYKESQEFYNRAVTTSYGNLVDFFLAFDGGDATRKIAAQENEMLPVISPWLNALPPLVKVLGQLLWPMSSHFTFMEFLIERCQPLAVQGYVRLLQNWCEWNKCSRKFLMGVALLTTGESSKACRWFLEAAGGVPKEDLLLSIINKNSNDSLQGEPCIRFYLIIVQLFEQTGNASAALNVALVALNSSVENDPLLPTLWSVVAKLHLQLGHYQEAYEAVVSNPDSSQRPVNLGRLVHMLLELKRMDVLLTFPYVGLESELEKIVERRARSSDTLAMGLYYSFLYAFHVRQGKMRKAAAVMYEQSIRYGSEGEFSQQVKCLLSCLNALRLVPKDEAWLVKPIQTSASKLSFKSSDRTVDVVEYIDIEKEYELSFACLNMGQSLIPLTASEVIALLTSRNLYESALRIAQVFEIEDLSSVMEHLAGKCVLLSRDSSEEAEAWQWLAENQCTGLAKASEEAWRLLERLLPRAESGPKQTRCHRAVAKKILFLGFTLPHWLIASYKLRNPAELISLYHQAGYLEDATRVAIQLIDAVLGKGKEYFGFTSSLHVNSPAVWLPYTAFNRLILELKGCKEPLYNELLAHFQHKLKSYLQTAETVSHSVIQLAMS